MQAIHQGELSLCIQRDTSDKRTPPQILLPTMAPNGFENQHHLSNHTSQMKMPPTFERLVGPDLQRVHSDALPKHQVASKIFADHERLQANMRVLKRDSQENFEMEIASDINSTAVEVGSSLDTDSHHTISSFGIEGENRSELNRSHSLPSVDEVQEPEEGSEHRNSSEIVRSNTPQQFSPGFYPSLPDNPWKPEERFACNPTKSQSVTELSTINPLPTMHSRDKSDTGVTNYYRSHHLAKKTESLPGKFRAFSPLAKNRHSDRSSSTTPGAGLGFNLQNMNIEDMHSASKLEIDQIWKEVESRSEDETGGRNQHHLHMDTTYTQTPEEWSEDFNGTMIQSKEEPSMHSSSLEMGNSSNSQDRERKRYIYILESFEVWK